MEEINFTVDAGIINRLGLELVSKSETAVAELIKNAYDADATTVKVYFQNTKETGGQLVIDDNGEGMNRQQLINGFMRLATTEKLHNTVSNRFKRPKAGKKGIGRFSSQRLGKKLVIITETEKDQFGLQLTINWEMYETDKELSQIKNTLEEIPKDNEKKSGTKLIIQDLRDVWKDSDIKRVYRFVSELIQPNFLTTGKENEVVEENKEEFFEPLFFYREDSDVNWRSIADPQIMMLNKALCIFSGYVDENGFGHAQLKSKEFHIDGSSIVYTDNIEISSEEKKPTPFQDLAGKSIHFLAHYFITASNRRINYYSGLTKPELNAIKNILDQSGGIKIYRNGFKVPKYADKDDDWLGINKSNRIGKGVPYTNKNLLGFVQIQDHEKAFFEEVAGREGIIEKPAFQSLQIFIKTSLESTFKRFVSFFQTTDEYQLANQQTKKPYNPNSFKESQYIIKNAVNTLTSDKSSSEEKEYAISLIEAETQKLGKHLNFLANELEMLRVLAGVGLTIAEFVHEVKQFVPSLRGYINSILHENISKDSKENLKKMNNVLESFLSYTAYFDLTVSENVVRELRPIDLRDVIKRFIETVEMDTKRRNITINVDFEGYDLITQPMHPSEWNTILQNLYSNAKKAISRAEITHGKILITGKKEKDKLYFSFCDNGTGIPKKYHKEIFNSFFTTSNILKVNEGLNENTGSGLGLYILKQIIINRSGLIEVKNAPENYNTCIHIELPLVTQKQLKEYDY